MPLNIDVTQLTMDELEEGLAQIKAEIDTRLTLDGLKQEADRLAGKYAEAVEGKPAREWVEGMVIGPGEKVIEAGVEYRNISGAWLSVPPSAYPLGFRQTVAPPSAAPFVPGEVVQANDLRLWKGIVYKAVQSHTTALHYAPDLPGVTALWVVA